MTLNMPPSTPDPGSLTRRIDGAVERARLALIWERVWPRLVWPIGIAALFIGLSWLGVWRAVPDLARFGLVAGFAMAFATSFVSFRGMAWPTRTDAVARVERTSGLMHRPLAAFEDHLASRADEATSVLWAAHRARVARSIGPLTVGVPHPDVPRKDRFGLRVAVGIVLFIGAFAASGQYTQRIADAFRPADVPPVTPPRLDAWVTPPSYTGRTPIYLTGDATPGFDPSAPVRVPEGSRFVLRLPGEPGLTVEASTTSGTALALEETETARAAVQNASATTGAPSASTVTAPRELTLSLAESARVEVRGSGALARAFVFEVEPDADPTITFNEEPQRQGSGALKLVYATNDDYGVAAAFVQVAPTEGSYVITSTEANARPLVSAPDFPLTLPKGKQRIGTAQTIRDLSAHPWAGALVSLTPVVRDEAGQQGRGAPIEIVLPQRTFQKPMARALVEQRRILALDANRQGRVLDAIDGLLIAPELFFDDASIYLGVAHARTRLLRASTDDELREVLDVLWQVALQIEDGDLSEAQQQLRDAQEALRQALENGATDEEIKRLMDNLRQAMDRYFRELAQQMQRNPQAQQQQNSQQRQMRQQDLDRMLNRIEDLARSGSRDAAKDMLSQLQQMLENLQMANPNQMQQGGAMEQMQQMMDQLGEMIQRQQQLMDRTHRADRQGQQGQQGQRQPGQRPQPGQRGQQGQQGQQGEGGQPSPQELAEMLRQLQQGQGDLAQRLQELMDQMQQQGMGQQGGESGQQLGQAGREMGSARDQLGQGETGDALGSQGRALENLRQGAQSLAQEMMNQMGQGQQGNQRGPGPGGPPNMANQPFNEDPLGRPRRNEGEVFGENVEVPDEIDTQRARQILEDIRRRLSEPFRPMIERDYLERLLRSE